MSNRQRQSAFAEFVLEQMSGIPGVGLKAMFGGYGIYREGLMFALIADESLYFKADDALVVEFTALGLPPFVFESRGKSVAMKYHLAPESVFEESAQMRHWADKAFLCAVRNAAAKAVPRPGRRR